MLKIGQNLGKIANYPPNALQRSAPLLTTLTCKSTLVLVMFCVSLFWFLWFTADAEKRKDKPTMTATRARVIAMFLILNTMSTTKSKITQSCMVI